MSFSKKGKDFPKEGRVFPRQSDTQTYAFVVAAALRGELGESHHATKTVIRWTGASERAVKNWFSGTSGPSGEHLIALARNSDEVFATLLILSERTLDPAVAANKLVELRSKLRDTLQFIESIFEREDAQPS
jgi:hypothetical protein